MFITVKEALALPAMADAILVAGSEGLERKITSVNIMEVPGISRFVKEEELIVTTMYPIRENGNLKLALIPNLVEKGVSALAISPLNHDRDIPSVMVKLADEHAFPLIRLPMDTSFNEILNPILEQILDRKHIEVEHRYRARIIGDLLSGKISSKSQIIALSQYYNWGLSKGFLPILMKLDPNEYDHLRLQLHTFSDISEKCGIGGTIATDFEFGILLLIPYSDTNKCRTNLEKITKTYLEIFPNTFLGIGRPIADILELPKGLREAKQAATLSEKLPSFGRIVDFDSLGIYRVLAIGDDEDFNKKQTFVKEKLSALLDYDQANKTDLFLTLQEFFNEGGNSRKAAKKLFVHYNTMRNRLNLIEEISGIDLSVAEARLEMQVAIKIAAIL
ncbi:MAG: PucR family transcriptional regulator ligand-binding domain-containing protein [Defluviitaleaceae bacterium]|nr:PucR family transcriptional regulator ligand-binding domain-containing protein [Defluviitaleaceae bacterium]